MSRIFRKVALITGSTSGIGLGIAERLAKSGYAIVLTGLGEQDKIYKVINGLKTKYHERINFVPGDLTSRESVATLCETVTDLHIDNVDILVNNAGFQYVSPVEEFPLDVWDSMLAVHLTAPFLLARHFLPGMKRKGTKLLVIQNGPNSCTTDNTILEGWGRVINMSSMNGLVSQPGKVAYSTTKSGLIGMTRAVALETAEFGITVNAICPGFVETESAFAVKQIETLRDKLGITYDEARTKFFGDIHPTKAPVTTEQIASMVSYLCTDDAASITGTALTMDAGNTAR